MELTLPMNPVLTRTKNMLASEELLFEISDFCQRFGIAESTFGRRAVNDGKFVGRLKYGGRVTTTTVERVRSFMDEAAQAEVQNALAPRGALNGFNGALNGTSWTSPRRGLAGQQNFRFYDNRQKYLMFVNTCSEKWMIAQRVAQELDLIQPRPPAIRLFDAGAGAGTVLSHAMRAMHRRFERYPFYVVGKEISLEDVRLTLEKAPDRLFEHPATALVMTNLPYAEAPWLVPSDPVKAAQMVWKEVALEGSTTADFEEQIAALQPFLAENWRTKLNPETGGSVYERPVVLVIYREDCRFLLDTVLPRRGAVRADFDLVIASQPYRARASDTFKARRVIAPLAEALAPGGRLLGIHSCGGDPGLEIIQRVWPGEQPFQTDRHALLRATKTALGKHAHDFVFPRNADAKALFRYDMHTLPDEIGISSIGTSTLLAAWNAATYVGQIEDQRLASVMSDQHYLLATKEVLQKHGGLWFFDESYVIARKRSGK
jgi:SAM-dependent methyltransferase